MSPCLIGSTPGAAGASAASPFEGSSAKAWATKERLAAGKANVAARVKARRLRPKILFSARPPHDRFPHLCLLCCSRSPLVLYAREAGASGASAILFSSLIAKSRLSLSADSQSCSLACYFRRLIRLLSTRQIIF